MASLVLGPILRHIGASDATVWVETDSACEVDVLGRTERTFRVDDRHYAIVAITGLEPDTAYEYEVLIDGERAWPEEGSPFPPAAIRTVPTDRRLRLVFGSCRVSAPHTPPFTRKRARDPCGSGIDALRALALRTAAAPPERRPDALLMLGDQIYADEPSVGVTEFTRSHQPNPDAPRDQLEDFTEYALAYCDAWSDPAIRWLLASVPSAMIFDDHEIHDEWRISQAWVDEMRAKDWYESRIVGGLMSYWLYQHLGNLSPAELAESKLLRRARECEDAGPLLREFGRAAERQPGRSRWSFCRDFGRIRLVVLDARGGRTLEPGKRRILEPEEWSWVEERMTGDFDHLLVASSIPFLVGHGLHYLEAFAERVCDGALGARAAAAGERLRQRANLGHWAAFQDSFHAFALLLEGVAAGRRGRPPASIVLLSGDVHHCYLAEVGFRAGSGATAPTWQAVCSGLRKQLDPREKRAMKLANSPAIRALTRTLARVARVAEPTLAWRLREGPVYANQVATLELDRERVRLEVETTEGADWREPQLRPVFARRLAGGAEPARS